MPPINTDQSVKVVILTGREPAFCSGGNIKHMRSLEGFMAGPVQEVAEGYRSSCSSSPSRCMNCRCRSSPL
ncbi:enoyl-CoA hydratase-related protein [Pseudoroseomonas wenyumeiae]